MPSTCTFRLLKENGVYYAGDVIEGEIVLVTTKDKNVKDMFIKFNGRVKTRWEEEVKVRDLPDHNAEKKFPSLLDDFTNSTITLPTTGVLAAGTYNFSFRFETSKKCQTSYESSFGHVRYELSLEINQHNIEYSNIFKRAVTIIQPFDLNIRRKYSISPVECSSNKGVCKTCCFGFLMKEIYFTFHIPFAAYTPGQTIRFTIRMHNRGTEEGTVESCSVFLFKRTTYTGEYNKKEKTATVTNVVKKIPNLERKMRNNAMEDELIIPSVPPTTDDSHQIWVQYQLKAQVELVCCDNSKLVAIHDITIGTVPLRASLTPSNEEDNQDAAEDVSMQNMERMSPVFVKQHKYQPFIDPDIEAINRLEYCPLYPTYSSPEANN